MLTLVDNIDLRFPPLIKFGFGTLSKLSEWIDAQGYRHPFVVADPFNAGRLDLLGLGEVAHFGAVEPEPGVANLADAVAAAKDADVVIGFGGGSAMDLAKLVSILRGRDLQLDDIRGPNRAPARGVGLVQIPTTAGTGSEIGARALVTDPQSNNKIATESPYMLADLAIVDPELSMSVPAAITAATGVDAMAHCVEAFTSKRAHPVIDMYAREGIRLIGHFLRRAVEDREDAEARAGLALAALYGGVCLGPVNTTAGHALSYPLGTQYKLPHGIANALIFPHVLAANEPAVAEKTREVLHCLGLSDAREVKTAALGFCEGLGLDMQLRAHGVQEDSLTSMAQEAHGIRRLLDWNPVDLSLADIEAIYKDAY
ncbi:iron-containing alcohol dehydrogenase [Paracoccaceae bacterium GXU_MW_L88]